MVLRFILALGSIIHILNCHIDVYIAWKTLVKMKARLALHSP